MFSVKNLQLFLGKLQLKFLPLNFATLDAADYNREMLKSALCLLLL